MRKSVFKSCASVMTIGLASMTSSAFAQDAAAEETSALDEIVVTASSGNKTQLNSAVAVTTIDADLVENFKPSSEAEVFRLIPGIQASGTSGPGGNANIAVRGLPVATGGSPFVQLQEDGLPTVLFGDIQFGNNDYWTRFDASVERLQSVRGGGATTFTSQAPGAVINYISNTGKEQGGYLQLSKGINFNDTKLDFRYGAPITEDIRFHIGGFYRNAHGPLNNFKVSDSIQIKANVTGEFADGKGYVRALFKFADTQDPNYTGAPSLATKNGNKIGNYKPFPGFDGREDSNYSSLNRTGLFLNRAGVLQREDINGITTKQLSAGMQFHYELTDNITIDNNFRGSKMSGAFASPFLNVARTSSVFGSVVNGQTVAAIRYASGPNAGQLYTATYLDNNVNVRTKIRDAGSLANNLTLSGEFGSDGFKITPRAGFFLMRQDIAMDWHVNKSTRALDGNNPSQLDLFNAAGNKLTVEGISGYNNNWGDCCARDYDLKYTNTAPYVALELDSDMFGLDASIRFESIKAEGSGRAGGAPFNVVSSGVTIPALFANGPREILDYSRSYRSWTVGGLFKPTDQLSIFARASEGGRFNADRQTFGGKFTTTGGLCTSAQAPITGAGGIITRPGVNGCQSDGVTPSVDFVKQYEVGLKNAGSIGGGRYSLELSLLKANFKQSTFELSATRCPGGAGGCVIDAKYKSSGAEFYGTYRNGGFNLVANATYTKAKQLGSGATAYRRASFLPDLTYTVSANYDIGDLATVGLAATGQSSIRDDGGNIYEGGAIFNGNIAFRPIKNVEIGLQAYNLFNSLDLRGNGNTVVESTGNNALVTGTPVIGRTFSASARFSF